MFRKLLLACAAVFVLGGSAFVSTEASAGHRHHGWGGHHWGHHHHWRHHHWRRHHWGWGNHHVRCWRWVMTPYGYRRVWVCG
jgi:hypothetical protein